MVQRILRRASLHRAHGPKSVQIEHTNRCNLKCVMCSHSYNPPETPSDMCLEDFERIIDGIMSLGALEYVQIQGLGEPFLHKHFLDMVRHAKTLGLRTQTITNMTVMTTELADAVVESGLDMLHVSLDTLDPAVMAFLRQGASFNVLAKILDNLERLKKARDNGGRDTPEIAVFMLAMRATLSEVPHMVECLARLGIKKLVLANLNVGCVPETVVLPNGQPLVEQPLTTFNDEDLYRHVQALRALSTDMVEVVPPSLYAERQVRAPSQIGVVTCRDLWERPAVELDQTVTPCCYTISSKALVMGNLQTQSFQDIWHGEAYKKLRLMHLSGRPPEVCRHCSQLYQLIAHYDDTREAYEAYPHKFSSFFI